VSDSSEGGPGKSDLAERQATLEAFARAIDHEAHVLSVRPDLVWQQLYNRLQWEEDPIPDLLPSRGWPFLIPTAPPSGPPG
jgi:hypothetical protein